MPKFKYVTDSETNLITTDKTIYPATAGSDLAQKPQVPTIEELQASQAKGATGTGYDQTYADKMASINQGTGVPVADSE